MYMRLGFAVAIHVDPDVLLVDEVLAVGDEGFTHKCLDKFGEFRRRGKTILLVTHSLGLVERFCDEALWIDGGLGKATGDPRRVVGAYMTDVERDRRSSRWPRRTPAAQEQARHGAAAPPVADPVAATDDAGRHVPRERRPLGIARGRDHRRDASSGPTASRRTCSTPATR